MAIIPPQLIGTATTGGTTSTRFHQDKPTVDVNVHFAGSGTLKVGQALAFDTTNNYYVEAVNAGANGTGTVRGIVYPKDITITAAGEIPGEMFAFGDFAKEALVANASMTIEQIAADIAKRSLDTGLVIRGQSLVRGTST